MTITKQKITLGYAAGSSVTTPFAQSLAELANYRSPLYTLEYIFNETSSIIDMNRNNLVYRFLLYTSSDWLMMLDTDLSFEYDILDRLLELANEQNAKICSGWYNVRINVRGQLVPLPLIHKFEDNDRSRIIQITDDSPVAIKADGVGAGMLLIHREVLEKIRDLGEYPFKFTHNNFQTITEDMHFCKLVKQLGYQIYVHRDVHALHYKSQPL